jgi:hypothetical protein
MDAIYIITPKPHIVDCMMAEFDQRRYRGFFLIWTTLLPPHLKERIDRSQMAREQIRSFRTVHLDFHPQESHLITFKDPWSFPILYHPECNNLVVRHMEDIAERVGASPPQATSANSPDNWHLRRTGRIPHHPLLPTAGPNPRGQRLVLTPCPLRPG